MGVRSRAGVRWPVRRNRALVNSISQVKDSAKGKGEFKGDGSAASVIA